MTAKLTEPARDDSARGKALLTSAGSAQCSGVPEQRQPRRLQVSLAGAGIAVSAAQVLAAPLMRRHCRDRLRRLMRHGAPMTISLRELHCESDRETHAIRALQAICEFLAEIAAEANYEHSNLGLCVRSHLVPVQALALISGALLGDGPRYVFLDNLQMTPCGGRQVRDSSADSWRALWQFRDRRLQPVYGGVVRSTCSLLSDEVAGTVLPGLGAVVPASTAWAAIPLQLEDFLHDDGHLDWRQLSFALAAAVRDADRLLDGAAWACRELANDARHNRRLAVRLSGVGAIVEQSGRDARALDTLGWINGIVRRVRAELRAISRSAGRHHGPLPALSHADPSIGLQPGPTRDRWRRRWKEAIGRAPVRHRNMLLLAAEDVLPVQGASPDAHFDLLPVLRHADAWCFPPSARYRTLGLRDYQAFHCRARAVIRACSEGCVVAARD